MHKGETRPAKGRFKRAILPPLIGIGVVAVIFGGLNSQFILGKITYAISLHHVKEVTQKDEALEHAPVDKNAPPYVTINKIQVNAPVIYPEGLQTEAEFQKLLQHGVVHYPNTAVPGQTGNVVMFGHSSGRVWAPGDYKFVFSLLEKVEPNDTVFLTYKGLRYTYKVTSKKIVDPTDTAVLQPSTDSRLTLLTCYPVGTSKQRTVIVAKQIFPKPQNNTTGPSVIPEIPLNGVLPGSDSSIWDSLQDL